MFLRLEQPARPGDPAEGDDYETIGQFYDAVEKGLRDLCAELGEDQVFTGDPARQVAGGPFAHTAGHLAPSPTRPPHSPRWRRSSNRARARHARRRLGRRQGTLFHPETKAVSHYYRFQELAVGRRFQPGDTPESGPTGDPVTVDPAGIRPVRPDQRLADHPEGHAIRTAQEAFNQSVLQDAPDAGTGLQRQPGDARHVRGHDVRGQGPGAGA